MKQRVGGGWFAGLVGVLAAACGGTDMDSGSAGGPSTAPTAGMSSPPSTVAGTSASAGSKATAAAGTGGPIGTTTNPVSSSAGSKAAGGSAAAVGATASAAGTGVSLTAGTSASGTAGSGGGSAATAGATAAAGGAASGGCGSESFKAIYDSIFKSATNNCAGAACHGRDAAMAMTVGNLSLSSAAVAYMQLVKVNSTSMACSGKPRVVPGDAAGSLLVQKLRGATTTCGGAMPVGAEEIPDTELKRISDWINAGACDN